MKHRLYGQAPSKDAIIPFSGASGRALAQRMGLPTFGALHDLYVVENVLSEWPGAGPKGDLFPMGQAREKAAFIRATWNQYDHCLLVGKQVAQAFGFSSFIDLVWHSVDDGTLIAIVPHPSGVNHFWNDKQNAARADAFLRSAAVMAMRDAGGWS